MNSLKKRIFKISCVIPAYNEEGRIGNVVKIAKSHPLIEEVIVVSDGSKDRTAQEAKLAGADRVIELKRNIGKGGAVFIGVREAKTDFVILLDGDLINLSHYHIDLLIDPIKNGTADMTIGVLVDDINQRLLAALSGQRVLKKEIILNNPHLIKSRFQLERLINHYAKEKFYRVKFVDLKNLSHLKKFEKYDRSIALIKYLDAFFSFFIFYLKKFYFFFLTIFYKFLNFNKLNNYYKEKKIIKL